MSTFSSSSSMSITPPTQFFQRVQEELKNFHFEDTKIQRICDDLLTKQQELFPQIASDFPKATKTITKKPRLRAKTPAQSKLQPPLQPVILFPSPKECPSSPSTRVKRRNIAHFIHASSSLPLSVLITKRAITLINPEMLNSGGESNVYAASLIPTQDYTYGSYAFSPALAIDVVVKRYRYFNQPLSQISRDLNNAFHGHYDTTSVDDFLSPPLIDPDHNQYSIHKRYTNDLLTTMSDLQFYDQPDTVLRMLQILIRPAFTLNHMHQNGFLHRDIKSSNILTASTYGALSDFGTIVSSNARDRTPFVVGTRLYMDPKTFGKTASESLENQKKQQGYQTTSCDVSAFGRTLCSDVLSEFFTQVLVSSSVKDPTLVKHWLSQLAPGVRETQTEDHFTKQTYENTGFENFEPDSFIEPPFSLYVPANEEDGSPALIVTYPDSQTIQYTLIELCNILLTSGLCTKEEHTALVKLSILTATMCHENPEERPFMDKVHQALVDICMELSTSKEEITPKTPPLTPTKKHTTVTRVKRPREEPASPYALS